ncbi:lipocalin family protein [uncultured Capnocytophaga sp.]|uniref:lipocalin family protein n=1 Tax=uncultured Capnocytophaga sp. TaxID=159273 RepID=UPI00261A3141|nr:lipocalin family protein [uncultured Capnocytophaga sp.]
MRKLVGFVALLALCACSKKPLLQGDWQIVSIIVNDRTQPLDDCTKKTYLSFGKDSITYHTFVPFEDCKENISRLPYTATPDSIKVTNELKRIERSHYAIKGDTLTITDATEIKGQKIVSKVKLVRKTSDK